MPDFTDLNAEITAYLADPASITIPGLLRLLRRCQAAALEMHAELTRLNDHLSYIKQVEASQAAMRDVLSKQDSFDLLDNGD